MYTKRTKIRKQQTKTSNLPVEKKVKKNIKNQEKQKQATEQKKKALNRKRKKRILKMSNKSMKNNKHNYMREF